MYERAFIHEFREAIEESNVPVTHKHLLYTFSNHAKSDGSRTFPSQARLAEACLTTDRTIRTWSKHLEAAGWLELTSKGGSGNSSGRGRRSNEYQLRIGRPFKITKGSVEFTDRVEPEVEPEVPLVDDFEDGLEDGWTPALAASKPETQTSGLTYEDF